MRIRSLLLPLLMLLAIGLLARSLALVALAGGLLLILLGAEFWGKRSLAGVGYRRRVTPDRVFPGEQVELSLTWENRKWLPLPWLESDEEVPEGFGFPEGFLYGHYRPERQRLVNLLPLGFYERVSRRFTFVAGQRGHYSFGPGRLRSGDLFGLFTSQREEEGACELLVYPRLLPPEQFNLPPLRPLGNYRWGPPFFEDPTRLAGVREYQSGDPLGRVHWKATARIGTLQVKVYEPSTTMTLGLFLNSATYPAIWQGIDPLALERLIEVTAALASDALSQGHQVGLYGNGLLPGISPGLRLPPAAGPAQLQRILEVLARLAPLGTEKLPDLLAWEGRRLPWGASAVLVTALMTEETLQVLQDLRRHGNPVAVVAVGDRIPDALLPDFLAVHRVRLEGQGGDRR